MITDRIGLHSVLLPLLIVAKVHREIVSVNFNRKNLTVSRIEMGKNLTASPKKKWLIWDVILCAVVSLLLYEMSSEIKS